MTDMRARYVLARMLPVEMMSRGTWDTERVERYVGGYYKFNPPQAQLNRPAWERMRELDPGLPQWDVLLSLLEDSDMRDLVHA